MSAWDSYNPRILPLKNKLYQYKGGSPPTKQVEELVNLLCSDRNLHSKEPLTALLGLADFLKTRVPRGEGENSPYKIALRDLYTYLSVVDRSWIWAWCDSIEQAECDEERVQCLKGLREAVKKLGKATETSHAPEIVIATIAKILNGDKDPLVNAIANSTIMELEKLGFENVQKNLSEYRELLAHPPTRASART